MPVINFIKEASDNTITVDVPSKLENNESKFVFSVTQTTVNESTSCISWFHSSSGKKQKRFIAKKAIVLMNNGFDLLSPDLRKLCERFEKL